MWCILFSGSVISAEMAKVVSCCAYHNERVAVGGCGIAVGWPVEERQSEVPV